VERLTFEFGDGVARITFSAPERGNAIDAQWARQFRDIASALHRRSNLRVVMIRSQGKAFCVGGDLRAFAESADPGTALGGLADDLHAGLLMLTELDAPVIVSVQGAAAGAGMSLVLAADLAIAGAAASFTVAYTRVGLSPDGGCSYWLPRLVGHRRAKELMLTNRRVGADEAREIGVVNEVVEDAALEERAEELAAQVAVGPTSSYGTVKRLLEATERASLAEQLAAESAAIALAADSPNGREGIAAFVEKRRPAFTAR